MKLRGWHNHQLVKWTQLVTLFGLPLWAYVLIVYGTLTHLTLCAISIILISKVGHSAGQHRYFCHRSFTTGPRREWLLGLLSTLCTTYSAPHYAGVHRWHHIHSDSELDPHTPRKYGLFRTFLGFTDSHNTAAISGKVIRDLIKNRPAMFFYDWYWPTIVTYWILLCAIDPLLMVPCYLIPVGYTQFVNGTQTFFGHKWGYKNHDLGDDSTNNIWWNIITLGEGLHNNHHHRPSAWDFAWERRPGEWDFTGWLIRVFLAKS